MLKMVVKRGFYDKQADKYRLTGEQFVVDGKRAVELVAASVAAVVETAAEPISEETDLKVRPKRRKKGE